MIGMGHQRLNLTNTIVVSWFRHALYVSSVAWLVVLTIGILILLGRSDHGRFANLLHASNEPRARMLLRRGFGVLWFIDGLLQLQPAMPLGLANHVVAPILDRSPSWLRPLMGVGITLWNSHPITLAVGVAWLQIGIGVTLFVASGRLSHWVGGASALWAAMIWLVGNGAGGIFLRGSSILFGWPGASVFYVIAGAWLLVTPRLFRENYSTLTLRLLSLLLVGAIKLQSMPSAQFWHGGSANAIAVMTRSMTATAQPRWLAWFVRDVGSLASRFGSVLNIVVVAWLALCAVGLWLTPSRRWRWPVRTLVVGCLFLWVATEDTSLFGGLATDVNSLLPLALLAWCAQPRLETLTAATLSGPVSGARTQMLAASSGLAMVLFAVATMGWATFGGAETTQYVAENGPAVAVGIHAPLFSLTDQRGRRYSLAEHRGRSTLLAFLGPRCGGACQQFLQQVRLLAAAEGPHPGFAVVVAEVGETAPELRHLIVARGLAKVENFYFLHGPPSVSDAILTAYQAATGGAYSPTQKIFIVSSDGRLRWQLRDRLFSTSSDNPSAVAEFQLLLAARK